MYLWRFFRLVMVTLAIVAIAFGVIEFAETQFGEAVGYTVTKLVIYVLCAFSAQWFYQLIWKDEL